jgi:hypothetical protein
MMRFCRGAHAKVLDGFDFLVYQLGKRRMRATGAHAAAYGLHAVAET